MATTTQGPPRQPRYKTVNVREDTIRDLEEIQQPRESMNSLITRLIKAWWATTPKIDKET